MANRQEMPDKIQHEFRKAIDGNDHKKVEKILKKYLLPESLKGEQSLIIDACKNDKISHKILSVLIQYEPQELTTTTTKGESLLHIVAAQNHTKKIQVLLRNHIAINTRDHDGKTALHHLVDAYHPEDTPWFMGLRVYQKTFIAGAKLLIIHQIDVDAVDAAQRSALNISLYDTDFLEMANLLMQNSQADFNNVKKSKSGKSYALLSGKIIETKDALVAVQSLTSKEFEPLLLPKVTSELAQENFHDFYEIIRRKSHLDIIKKSQENLQLATSRVYKNFSPQEVEHFIKKWHELMGKQSEKILFLHYTQAGKEIVKEDKLLSSRKLKSKNIQAANTYPIDSFLFGNTRAIFFQPVIKFSQKPTFLKTKKGYHPFVFLGSRMSPNLWISFTDWARYTKTGHLVPADFLRFGDTVREIQYHAIQENLKYFDTAQTIKYHNVSTHATQERQVKFGDEEYLTKDYLEALPYLILTEMDFLDDTLRREMFDNFLNKNAIDSLLAFWSLLHPHIEAKYPHKLTGLDKKMTITAHEIYLIQELLGNDYSITKTDNPMIVSVSINNATMAKDFVEVFNQFGRMDGTFHIPKFLLIDYFEKIQNNTPKKTSYDSDSNSEDEATWFNNGELDLLQGHFKLTTKSKVNQKLEIKFYSKSMDEIDLVYKEATNLGIECYVSDEKNIKRVLLIMDSSTDYQDLVDAINAKLEKKHQVQPSQS